MMKTTTINQKLNLNEIKDWLKENLNDERYRHTLGVADCAKELALKFGVNPDKAYLAGLLHDCAKCLDKETSKSFFDNNLNRLTNSSFCIFSIHP